MFIVMVIVLRTTPNFDSWTSVIGLFIASIAIMVQKLIKIIFLHEII
jgi:hypothetical protein